jgi:hypothetical protein
MVQAWPPSKAPRLAYWRLPSFSAKAWHVMHAENSHESRARRKLLCLRENSNNDISNGMFS